MLVYGETIKCFFPGDTPFNSRQLVIARVSKVTLLNGSEVSDCVCSWKLGERLCVGGSWVSDCVCGWKLGE